MHHEVELLAVLIQRARCVMTDRACAERDCRATVSRWILALRDLQAKMKKQRQPWEEAKGFD